MNLIASVDKNWGLGCNGELLFRVKADMRWFRSHTLGNTVILGRKTLQSFPQGKPLPERKHIVLSRDTNFVCAGAEVAHDLRELANLLPGSAREQAWVIGGAQIYHLLLPYCQKAYLTRFDANRTADSFFPVLDDEPGWRIIDKGLPQTEDGLIFTFNIYQNDAPLPL